MTRAEEQEAWLHAPWLHAAVGQALRALRLAEGWRLEDVSDAARTAGLNWATSSVSQIESGKRRLTAEELVLLPQVLAWVEAPHAVQDEYGLEDLLAEPESYVRVSPTMVVTQATALRWMLGAGSIEPTVQQDRPIIEVTPRLHVQAAERLGRSLGDIEWLVELMWPHSRSLEDERDVRVREQAPATARSRQAARGHATRQLLRELGQAFGIVDDAGDHADPAEIRERLRAVGLGWPGPDYSVIDRQEQDAVCEHVEDQGDARSAR